MAALKVALNLLLQLEVFVCYMYGMCTVFERKRHHYFILSMAILIGSDMKIFII